MTVAELMANLAQVPPDLRVVLEIGPDPMAAPTHDGRELPGLADPATVDSAVIEGEVMAVISP